MDNRESLDTVCAALSYAMGIAAPALAAPANRALCEYVDRVLGARRADRLLMYNPDAIATWIAEKYPALLSAASARCEVALPLCAVMPSVTPVCFGTMYTGAQPEVHGIRKYEKPVITIDSFFDAAIRAGKRAAIVGDTTCSMGKIYLGREMDYFLYDTEEEITAKACELILADRHDLLVVYHGSYDSNMHKTGPESIEALSELRANAHAFATLCSLVKSAWRGHDTLVGFAMDHGCHEIDGSSGSHGLDMEEDLHITHLYRVYPASRE